MTTNESETSYKATDERVYLVLMSLCSNPAVAIALEIANTGVEGIDDNDIDDEGHKLMSVRFSFKNQALVDVYEDTGFDSVIGIFNSLLPSGWYCDDAIVMKGYFDPSEENPQAIIDL